ncbi:MAG: hypothetical protein ACHQ6V_14830, partial [Myxococcota bacterium]
MTATSPRTARSAPRLPWTTAALGLLLLAAGSARAASIAGTVFEDRNYGGGAGRTLAASGGTAIPTVRMELYNAAG